MVGTAAAVMATTMESMIQYGRDLMPGIRAGVVCIPPEVTMRRRNLPEARHCAGGELCGA